MICGYGMCSLTESEPPSPTMYYKILWHLLFICAYTSNGGSVDSVQRYYFLRTIAACTYKFQFWKKHISINLGVWYLWVAAHVF